MGFFVNLFKRKEEKVEVVENSPETIKDYELVNLLDSFQVTASELRVGEIETLSETVKSYLNGFLRELEFLKEAEKKDVEKSLTKIKQIVVNALELNNLLDQLVHYYHDQVLDVLNKVNKEKMNPEIAGLIEIYEKHKKNIGKVREDLNMFIVYDELFNPEKNSIEGIQNELRKKLDSGELYDVITRIVRSLDENVLDKFSGVKPKIDLDIMKKAKDILFS